MAKYRQVHVEFWQDGFVLDLTPEEKYFYIYLMTNSKTTQCGIYELPKRIIETETGYNRETVDKLLQRFIDYGKILYDEATKEMMLINWIKYNSIKSPKTKACIEKELTTVKNKRFVHSFNALCKEYSYTINTPYIDLGEEEEEEREEEREEEKEEEEEDANKEVFAANTSPLLKKYVSLRGYGFDHSPMDEKAAEEIIAAGVDLNDAFHWLEEKFKSYKPKHRRDRINSLDYCVGFILDKHYQKLHGEEATDGKKVQQHRRGNGRPSIESKESITGGKVGRL